MLGFLYSYTVHGSLQSDGTTHNELYQLMTKTNTIDMHRGQPHLDHFFPKWLTLVDKTNQNVTILDRLANELLGDSVLLALSAGLQICVAMLTFYVGAEDANMGPNVCSASIFPPEPPSWSLA